MDKTTETGVVIVRISDELFTPYLNAVCRRHGWTLRHPDMNADTHWVTVDEGTEHDAITALHGIKWIVSARRLTELRSI